MPTAAGDSQQVEDLWERLLRLSSTACASDEQKKALCLSIRDWFYDFDRLVLCQRPQERSEVLRWFHVDRCPELCARHSHTAPLLRVALSTPVFSFSGLRLHDVLPKLHPDNKALLVRGPAYDERAYSLAEDNLQRFRVEPTVWNWMHFWVSCTTGWKWRVKVVGGARNVTWEGIRSVLTAMQPHWQALEHVLARVPGVQRPHSAEDDGKAAQYPQAGAAARLLRALFEGAPPSPTPSNASRPINAGWQEEKEECEANSSESQLRLHGLTRRAGGVDGRLPMDWFDRAALVSRAVVRLCDIPGSDRATGFLISDRLIAACAHTFPTYAIAARCTVYVEFDVRESVPVRQRLRAELAPDECYWVHRSEDGQVDVAIIAFKYFDCPALVQPPRPVRLRGRLEHARDADNQVVLIGHSRGELMSGTIGTTSDPIRAFDGLDSVRYNNDTFHGLSGGPLFNMNWQLVAVHHGGTKKWSQGTTSSAIVRLLREDWEREATDTSAQNVRKWALLRECWEHAPEPL